MGPPLLACALGAGLVAACGPLPDGRQGIDAPAVAAGTAATATAAGALPRLAEGPGAPDAGAGERGELATPVAPTSALDPAAAYVLADERGIDGYAVRLWRRAEAEGLGFDDIVTIDAVGRASVAIEHASGIHPLSDTDITGDGFPEAIVETYSGGAHCCFATHVYSLGAAPVEVLRSPESNCPGRFEDLDGDGIQEFVTCDDGLAYAYCSFAASPVARVVLAYVSGRGYEPASSRYAESYADVLAADERRADEAVAGGSGEWDGSAKCAVLPLVLDLLHSGQTERAWEELARRYDGPDEATFRAEIEAHLRASPLYAPPDG